jgi:hypothetical protein|mmetsp:Transcript_18200/g.39288  ORF Transcript_18200/g.39288 Transcript_18200/m.39288 type:complete len:94 (-) Transcript_18200:91-372(-)
MALVPSLLTCSALVDDIAAESNVIRTVHFIIDSSLSTERSEVVRGYELVLGTDDQICELTVACLCSQWDACPTKLHSSLTALLYVCCSFKSRR